ncbi:MAG: DsbA family oxidoreductase [Deltaproteobacteria bacterium]|nr:DsbA family oxidoreductase [Deltaproteobacteria bacterium]
MNKRIHIDFWGDIACPWCFIGKRRLLAATEGRDDVDVTFHAFQLQPQRGPEPESAEVYLAKRFGGAERVKAMHARLQEAARPDGIEFKFEGQQITNTRLAHRIVAIAQKRGQAAAAAEALYRGQFLEGLNVGDLEVALGLLKRHGVPLAVEEVRAALDAGEGNEEVDRDLLLAARHGISGVPFVIANDSVAMEGAQPLEQVREFLKYVEEHPA